MKYEIVCILVMGYFPFCIFLNKTYFLSNLLVYVSKHFFNFASGRIFFDVTKFACNGLNLYGNFEKFFCVIGFLNGCMISNVITSKYFIPEIGFFMGYIMLLYIVSKSFIISRKHKPEIQVDNNNRVIESVRINVK